jgi:gliding motility-associated transport system ATP-binding protein
MHIRLENLTKRYGRQRAMDGISAEIEPGQILAVLGLNGAGKALSLTNLVTSPTLHRMPEPTAIAP